MGPSPADVKPLSFHLYFLAVHYLLNAQDRPLRGDTVTPKELRDGELFFSGGSHTPNFGPILGRFDGRGELLLQAGEALGGRGVDCGDAAIEIRVLPRVPITVILWFSDEEFPARASVLFDRSVEAQLPVEALLPLISQVVKHLAGS